MGATLSRKLFRLVERGCDRLTARAVAHPLQISQSCREPFTKEGMCFVSSYIPQNGTCFISACIKTQQMRVTQDFLASWFHWLETCSLFTQNKCQTRLWKVAQKCRSLSVISLWCLLPCFMKVISFMRQFHALLLPNASCCYFQMYNCRRPFQKILFSSQVLKYSIYSSMNVTML